jgi:small-conductance mechanosensitive channel
MQSIDLAVKWGQSLYKQVGSILPSLIVAVLIMLVALLVGYLVAVGIRKRGLRQEGHAMIYKLIAKLVRMAILVLGAICALGTVGISVSALVTSLGLVGFATGFALKDILASTLAGILLLIHRPFAVNDLVSVKGVEGKVVEIDLRFTVLHDGGKRIMVPNSIMLQEAVIVTPKMRNHSHTLS